LQIGADSAAAGLARRALHFVVNVFIFNGDASALGARFIQGANVAALAAIEGIVARSDAGICAASLTCRARRYLARADAVTAILAPGARVAAPATVAGVGLQVDAIVAAARLGFRAGQYRFGIVSFLAYLDAITVFAGLATRATVARVVCRTIAAAGPR
jgi:hypothetical protein